MRLRGAKDGKYRWLLVRFEPLRDQNGIIERWYGILTDIEDRKRAEAVLREVQTELAHANRIEALGQLAASIAHEVNQPTAAAHINANAALHFLDNCPPSLEEAREALYSVVKEALRARGVINGLRALVKKTPPQMQSFDLNEAIREVILITLAEAQQNNISVEMQLAEGLPFVPGDRVQLQQVIWNLVVNAMEAMRSHGERKRDLLICTRKTELNDVLVEVFDSGAGVLPATVEQLFESSTRPSRPVWDWGCRSAADHRSAGRAIVGEPECPSGGHLSLHSARLTGPQNMNSAVSP